MNTKRRDMLRTYAVGILCSIGAICLCPTTVSGATNDGATDVVVYYSWLGPNEGSTSEGDFRFGDDDYALMLIHKKNDTLNEIFASIVRPMNRQMHKTNIKTAFAAHGIDFKQERIDYIRKEFDNFNNFTIEEMNIQFVYINLKFTSFYRFNINNIPGPVCVAEYNISGVGVDRNITKYQFSNGIALVRSGKMLLLDSKRPTSFEQSDEYQQLEVFLSRLLEGAIFQGGNENFDDANKIDFRVKEVNIKIDENLNDKIARAISDIREFNPFTNDGLNNRNIRFLSIPTLRRNAAVKSPDWQQNWSVINNSMLPIRLRTFCELYFPEGALLMSRDKQIEVAPFAELEIKYSSDVRADLRIELLTTELGDYAVGISSSSQDLVTAVNVSKEDGCLRLKVQKRKFASQFYAMLKDMVLKNLILCIVLAFVIIALCIIAFIAIRNDKNRRDKEASGDQEAHPPHGGEGQGSRAPEANDDPRGAESGRAESREEPSSERKVDEGSGGVERSYSDGSRDNGSDVDSSGDGCADRASLPFAMGSTSGAESTRSRHAIDRDQAAQLPGGRDSLFRLIRGCMEETFQSALDMFEERFDETNFFSPDATIDLEHHRSLKNELNCTENRLNECKIKLESEKCKLERVLRHFGEIWVDVSRDCLRENYFEVNSGPQQRSSGFEDAKNDIRNIRNGINAILKISANEVFGDDGFGGGFRIYLKASVQEKNMRRSGECSEDLLNFFHHFKCDRKRIADRICNDYHESSGKDIEDILRELDMASLIELLRGLQEFHEAYTSFIFHDSALSQIFRIPFMLDKMRDSLRQFSLSPVLLDDVEQLFMGTSLEIDQLVHEGENACKKAHDKLRTLVASRFLKFKAKSGNWGDENVNQAVTEFFGFIWDGADGKSPNSGGMCWVGKMLRMCEVIDVYLRADDSRMGIGDGLEAREIVRSCDDLRSCLGNLGINIHRIRLLKSIAEQDQIVQRVRHGRTELLSERSGFRERVSTILSELDEPSEIVTDVSQWGIDAREEFGLARDSEVYTGLQDGSRI